jgi:peptide/nickel transport system ATP-binding protein
MLPIVDVQGLEVDYPVRRQHPFHRPKPIAAVRGVTLSVGESETVGLVGESGSGKTTTGRAVAGLVEATRGRILVEGRDLAVLRRRELLASRRRIQMVFQDPYTSLDPTMSVTDIIAEPVDAVGGVSRSERIAMVRSALGDVGLDPDSGRGYPHQFSGGQRQRIAIARALLLRPSFVICDEPVSALDASTKSQVLSVLRRLQREHGTAYLLISHDLPVVRRLSDRIAVMYAGRLVETGPARRVSDRPAHPYTVALIAASPTFGRGERASQKRIVLEGEPPSAADPPSGCAFRRRCPFAMEICGTQTPALGPVDGGGYVACHLQTSGPQLEGVPVSDIPESRLPGRWRYSGAVVKASGHGGHR